MDREIRKSKSSKFIYRKNVRLHLMVANWCACRFDRSRTRITRKVFLSFEVMMALFTRALSNRMLGSLAVLAEPLERNRCCLHAQILVLFTKFAVCALIQKLMAIVEPRMSQEKFERLHHARYLNVVWWRTSSTNDERRLTRVATDSKVVSTKKTV